MELKPLKQDLSIYEKFDFDMAPVAVKYTHGKPEGVKQLDKQLDKQLALCEMLKEAGARDEAFYITAENEDCVGKMALGWMEAPKWAEAGKIGEKFEIFKDGNANAKMFKKFYKLKPGLVNYVTFSQLDKLAFEPDLIILTAKPSQAEIILRAMSYSTGELWNPIATPVMGCSWLFAYPYDTGKVNYLMTGMHFGMKARKVMPEGYVLISIPYNWIPTITQNLNEMKWVLPAYEMDTREEWMESEANAFEEMKNEFE